MKRLEKITRELVEDLRAERRASGENTMMLSRPVRCLIVEDNESDAVLSMEAVGAVNCVTATLARSGDEAMDLLSHKPDFDIAFIDLKLAGSKVQGTDLINQMRDQFPRTHIVIVTGTLDPDATEFMSSGPQRNSYIGIIHKPLQADNLEEILSKHRLTP